MESTRPVRALLRGLDALAVLNLRDGATVTEVAGEIRLPRTTTYRVLETLRAAGYVFRDVADDRYRPTILVRGLSDGFDDAAWITQIAKPYVHALAREFVWPVGVATLSGAAMLVREVADHRSPLAAERTPAGVRVPLLASAPGRAYLAFCPQAQRDTLLAILARSTRRDDELVRNEGELARVLAEVRTLGHAVAVRPRRATDEIGVAVPIQVDDRVLACLAVRWSGATPSIESATSTFVPKLREAAARIRAQFLEQRDGDVPHARHGPA